VLTVRLGAATMSELNLPIGGMRRLAVMLIVSMLCTGAFAEHRVALVIGDSVYDHIARLATPRTATFTARTAASEMLRSDFPAARAYIRRCKTRQMERL